MYGAVLKIGYLISCCHHYKGEHLIQMVSGQIIANQIAPLNATVATAERHPILA
jgi:hypothetical protein